MHWRDTNLGKICDEVQGLIQTGPFGSQLHESDYSVEGAPVVMPKDIIGGEIETSSIARISKSHADRLKKHKLKAGDIVYGRRGDIGRQALIGDEQAGWLCGTGCLRISLGDTIINPGFLHYYLQEKSVIRWITNHAVGATMPNLNTAILRSVPIRMPEITYQRDIAIALSAYDNLIRNNLKRIKILERVAQQIYTEWFVRFRFPGYEKVKMIGSGTDFGKVPEGWNVENLSELVDFVRGVEPGSSNYKSSPGLGLVPFLRVGDLGSRNSKIFVERSIVGNKLISREDIVITMDGTVGRVAIGLDGAYSTGIRKLVIIDKRLKREYLYFLMLSDNIQNLINSHAKGTTILHASESIRYMKFILPNEEAMTSFSIFVKPIIDEMLVLKEKTGNLSKTRDLLIPQLVTGKLEVKI